MGKHSAPESPGFWRAVIIAMFRYVLILGAVAAVGFGVWRFVFVDVAPTDDPGGLEATPSLSSSFAVSSPSPTVMGEGQRIQILNGTTTTDQQVAAQQKLAANGYEVVGIEQAARLYDKTTVLYQPDAQSLGETIASLVRATVTQQAPDGLDPTIPVTVVVGSDYSG